MTLPTLSQEIFLAVMILLQIVDAWTTYDALRAGGYEANPIMRTLFERIGLREGLWVAKLLFLAYLIFMPITDPLQQWLAIGVYVVVAINNFHTLRKLRAK